jgi:hypothetical protein
VIFVAKISLPESIANAAASSDRQGEVQAAMARARTGLMAFGCSEGR